MTTSDDSQYSLDHGQLFEDNYEIVRELGRGGFGVIYLAQQLSMDRRVALKILKPEVGRHDPSARTRFLREVKIISKLRHPNTITIHDYGETDDGIIYMVLEYVEGTALKKVLKRQGGQPVMKSLGLARQIARSLDEAHRHDVIHRDLKPGNVMLTDLEGEADFVKVLDFGVARLRGSEDVDLTQAGVADGERALVGTPRYMSPEQVRGDELTGASDLYSLGLLLYEMLVGEPAIQGDTSMALIGQQVSPEPLDLDRLDTLHPRVQDLLRRATDKDIDQRFQSGDEVADAIDETAARIEAEQATGSDDFFATGPMSGASASAGTPSGPTNPDPGSQQQTQVATPSGESEPVLSSVDPDAGLQTGGQQTNSPRESGRQQDEPWHQSEFSASDFDYDPDEHDETQLYTPELDDPHGHRAREQAERQISAARSSHESAIYVNKSPDDESRLLGIPDEELPDAPADDSPSFLDEVDEQAASDRDDDEATPPITTFGIVKCCGLAVLAAFFVYAAFIVVGAGVTAATDGALRVLAALTVGAGIPFFAALGEYGRARETEVVERATDRLGRVFAGCTIFGAGVIVVLTFAMPGPVVDELRTNPNWMFDAPAQTDATWTPVGVNTRLSGAIAGIVEVSTLDIGWTGVVGDAPRAPAEQDRTVPEQFDRPEPTRPDTRPTVDDRDDDSTEQDDEPAAEGPPADDEPQPHDDEPRRPAPDDRPDPATPETDDDDPDDDYATW